MFEMFQPLINLVMGVSGGVLVSWALLAFFAPSVLSVISSWLVALSPLVKGLAEAVVGFVQHLWIGLKDMTDNISSVIFMITVIFASSYAIQSYTRPDINAKCKVVIDQLRKDFTFVPKKKDKTIFQRLGRH